MRVVVKNASVKKVFQVFIGISIFFIIIGLCSYLSSKYKIEHCTERVTATCTNIRKTSSRTTSRSRSRVRYKYTPVFTYTYNNKKYEVKYVKSYSSEISVNFEKGQEYTILVNPNNPKQYVVEGYENDSSLFGIILVIMGSGGGIFYTIIYLCIRKKEDNELLK